MKKLKKIIYEQLRRALPFITLFTVLISVFCASATTALAESTDTVSAYESQNVLDDLEGSTIAGVEFDLANYPYDENSHPQLINFVEFAYSYYSDSRDDFGLYVYVYNPQGLAIDNNSSLNQIEISFDGEKSWDKYGLEFLNYSTKAGNEGLFYKFKIALTASELTYIFKTLSSAARVYTISGIELSVGGTVTEYEMGTTYTYTGYSLGYGSALATESSLECVVTGYDRYVTLDVQQTVYYPEGYYYNGDQIQLNSCYFGVPNNYLENYGELTNILAEWYEYLTKPVLVTEDSNVFNAIYSLYGDSLANLSNGNEYLFMAFGNTSTILWGFASDSDSLCWTSNDYDNFVGHSGYYPLANGLKDYVMKSSQLSADKYFENFASVFYTGGTDYSEYIVSGDDLKNRILLNSNYLANNGYSLNILGKYCSYLFEDYIDSTGNTTEHVMGYNKLDITDDDIVTVYTTKELSKSFWQKAFGGYTVDTVYDNYSAMVKVKYNDIKNLTDSEISSTYLINENDVEDFKEYVKTAETNEETVYIVRYGCSNYSCSPIAQAYTAQASGMTKELCIDIIGQWDESSYFGYVFKETVYLNFDIISITFTAEDGTETVVPVVMSPQDVFSDSNPPLEEVYSNSGCGSFWENFLIVLAVLLLILLLILLAPVLPYVFKVVVWIIALPFRMLGAVFKALDKKVKSKKAE